MEFIRELVKAKKVTSFLATGLLMTFPYHVRYPNEKLLEESKILLNLDKGIDVEVKKVATLSFASLVRKTCENKMCSDDTQNKYIKIFLDRFKGNKSTFITWFLRKTLKHLDFINPRGFSLILIFLFSI